MKLKAFEISEKRYCERCFGVNKNEYKFPIEVKMTLISRNWGSVNFFLRQLVRLVLWVLMKQRRVEYANDLSGISSWSNSFREAGEELTSNSGAMEISGSNATRRWYAVYFGVGAFGTRDVLALLVSPSTLLQCQEGSGSLRWNESSLK